ncbi:hypothetical protein [Novosphingobium album (ex Liu et al. 2023)]|uniref:Histidine kinase/HSP90-like ATPase domain-containing protein n=1 Tax=Novosphingobium album (ex Liu et al. 2023) TaxID=3031130 RepID=A0ABT5WWQ0_9SPHN|nr:hypothetical protein [Novosphingobium album (ex Liu et al. 2023)]MDE8654276.1 hypothetical protein [Novosphingobium album (ex Liu et al. 2023)]
MLEAGPQISARATLPSKEIPMVRMFDLNQHLRTLKSLLDAQAGDRAEVALKVSAEKSPVKLDDAALDAALFELVANGRTALTTARRVIVRTKRVGRRLWLTVADTGMSREEPAAVLEDAGPTGSHSASLVRVHQFAQSCHARFRLRRTARRGSVAVITIPLVLNVGFTRRVELPPPTGMLSLARFRRGRPSESSPRMDTRRVEPKPDITEPLAPPEAPVPNEPSETPMPSIPEITPSQPDFVPNAPPEEYPAVV